MTLERIAVATAVISTTVSAGGLLLTWYRGSARQRPALARALGGLTVLSAAALAVGLGFAGTGNDAAESHAARGPLTAGEYRSRLIAICEDYTHDTDRIEQAEPPRPSFGIAVILEPKVVAQIKRLHPPESLIRLHQRLVDLWSRRVSLLGNFYDRLGRERDSPSFKQDLAAAIPRIDALSYAAQRQLAALDVTPECSIF